MARARELPGVYVVRRPEQVRALVSPVRQEVLDAAAGLAGGTGMKRARAGDASGREGGVGGVGVGVSIEQIARLLGRAPDGLYYHVRELERVGLMRRSGTRVSGSKEAALFLPAGSTFRIPLTRGGRIGNGAKRSRGARGAKGRRTQPGAQSDAGATKVIRAAMRLGARDFESAVIRDDAVSEGEGRNVWGGRQRAWVTRSELAELGRLIERINRLLARSRASGRGFGAGSAGEELRATGANQRTEEGIAVSFSYVLCPARPVRSAPKRDRARVKGGDQPSGRASLHKASERNSP